MKRNETKRNEVRLFIDLRLDALLLQNSTRSIKVMHQNSKYSKYILNSKMLALADSEEGDEDPGAVTPFSETEKLRISVSEITD